MKIKYTYTSFIPYEPLEDGTPNFHHVENMVISGESSLQSFLDGISSNSKIGNISNLTYSILNKEK